MTITRVQGNAAANTGAAVSSIAVTLSSAVGSGNAVVGCAVHQQISGQTVSSVTDDKSNTYTILDTPKDTGRSDVLTTFYAINITNAPTTITVNYSATCITNRVLADEFSGIATSSALDGHTGQYQSANPGTTDSLTSGTITTTVNGDLIWGVNAYTAGSSGIASIGTGFSTGTTYSATNPTLISEYLVQSSAGSVAATFSHASDGRPSISAVVALMAIPVIPYIPPRPRIQPVVRTYYVR